MVLLCTDKLLFSLLPLTKVTVQGERQREKESEKEREIERERRHRSLSGGGDSSQKKGQKLNLLMCSFTSTDIIVDIKRLHRTCHNVNNYDSPRKKA
jgi:hypothetical protein